MSRFFRWLPFLAGALLLVCFTLPAGRVPGGDAPHILAIAHRLALELQGGALADFYAHLGGLVTPHPPAGYLVPTSLLVLGFSSAVPVLTSLFGLGLCWHGLMLLRGEDARHIPLWGGLLLLSSGMTWAMVDRMTWDLLAAGLVVACLGHLHASRHLRCTHHAAAAGFLAALGCLTKFTVPVFLVVPGILALWAAISHRHFSGLAVAALVFTGVTAPWLSGHLDQVLAYVHSSADPTRTISESPADAWAARLAWDNLSYAPRVMRDALGWPGVALMLIGLGGLAHPGARMATGAAVGGLVILTFTGERQARYLVPALPLLCLLVDAGLGMGLGRRTRLWAKRGLLLTAVPMLYCSATTSWVHTDPPQVRDQVPEALKTWGHWPRPAPAFRPTGLNLDRWQVDAAIDALTELAPAGSTVGIAVPQSPDAPRGSAYAYQAARRGLKWDWATVARTPAGEPMVFLGPFPTEGAPRKFAVAYVVRRDGQRTALDQLPHTSVFRHRLPEGHWGEIIRISPQTWTLPSAQRLLKDPMAQ